jgi:hypothetical protein
MKITMSALLAVVVAFIGCGQSPQPDQAQAPKPGAAGQNQQIRDGLWIVDPADGAAVPERPIFAGSISDTTIAGVWLVVRAVGTPGYWVQPPAMVRPDRMWVSQPYIGLPSTAPGVKFEVQAFANPKDELKSGTELKGWPAAMWSSNKITVARQ